MNLIVLDFETHYGGDYTLSKMTTEAYVRDPRFETILVGFKINNGEPHYVVNSGGSIQTVLDSLDIPNNALLCHHAHFDGLILSHHYGIRPKIWLDTLSMARVIHGTEVGGSLRKLLDHYQVGVEKGTAVNEARNKRLRDFSGMDLINYALYCCDDVEGTYRIFNKMAVGFPKKELQQIDMLVRMFTEPILELDVEMLEDYRLTIQSQKATALIVAGVTKDEVMSDHKFADALRRVGVEPPMKVSKTTGKQAFAFAKTDQDFLDLQEHPDDMVQALVEARLGNKTTINESRAQRMIEMAGRGPSCLYYKYAGAEQTHRVSGGDSMNWQNLQRGGVLRDAIYAPEGYLLFVVDSSNIEARMTDYTAGQEDMLQVYRNYDAGIGPDVYCAMAERLFERTVTEDMFMERQTGKTVKLACGYQMGPDRYIDAARLLSGGKVVLTIQEARRYVDTYRRTHPMVVQLWNRAKDALSSLAHGPEDMKAVDPRGLLRIEKNAIVLPTGLKLHYPSMYFDKNAGFDGSAGGWVFKGKRGTKYIYGGKLIENGMQALSKIAVMDQLVDVRAKYKGVMTSHDEGVFCVQEDKAEEALKFALECMRVPPKWAPGLPVNAKGKIAIRYGDAK